MSKVVALAGGVGGAKLVLGLSRIIPAGDLSIIVNTGDDFIHCGLYICPDLDTVMYTLAGESNEITGWGRKNETWNCLNELTLLDPDTWFRLGDRDLAIHMERTRLLGLGKTLTEVTKILYSKLRIAHRIYPMTDDRFSTVITTKQYGDLPFQEYFVKYQFQPIMERIKLLGAETAKLNPETRKSLEEADVVIICPSNPWLSIEPILAIEDTMDIISRKTCVAVSPIVGHEAIKGPAAKIFNEKGIRPCAAEVAKIYKDLIDGFVLDIKNLDEAEEIRRWGIIPLVTDTIMRDEENKIRLGKEVFEFASQLFKGY